MSLIAWLLIAFSVCGIKGHEVEDVERRCIHSQYIEPQLEHLVKNIESIPLETHRAANAHFNPTPARSLLQANSPAPIRIYVEYQLEGLDPARIRFMKEKLMPEVQGVFQRALNVKKPVTGQFYLPYACVSSFVGFPSYCHEVGYDCGTAKHNRAFFGEGRTCIQPYDDRSYGCFEYALDLCRLECTELPRGRGVPNADFILYVTARADAGCLSSAETVASAGFCTYDMDNWYGLPGRPLAGVANFCPNNLYVEEDMFGYMLDTAVHEVLHALVMSKQLFERFIDTQEQTRQNAVVQRGGSLVMQTPAVIRAARSILGCPTMTGAKLEDEGGYGTADSHWERRLFIGEIMIGSSSASKRVVFSNLTLAMAEDSGWYIPKYEHSGVLSAVEHRGCAFVEEDCRRFHSALEETFCWETRPANQQPAVCTPDHMAIGYCKNDMSLMGGCSITQPFKNTHCTESSHDAPTQHVDLGMRHRPGARCFPVESYKLSRTENFFTVYRSELGAACFDAVCKGKQLFLRIPRTEYHDARDIRCPTGNFIDLSDYDLGYDEGTIGPCPNNDLLCESWGCPDDCSSNGMCLEGKCYCNIGYVGPRCAKRPCPQNPCNGTDTCQIETGECFPSGFSILTSPSSTEAASPKPKESGERASPEPARSSPSMSQWGPRPATSSPRTRSRSSPKPSKPKERGSGDEPFVQPTDPKQGPRIPRPLKSPVLELAPEKPTTEAFDVPAYGPSEKDQAAAGRVVAVGYLSGCLVYEDTYGDLRIRPGTTRRYTKEYGEWTVEHFPKDDQLVVDPGVGDKCLDVFTDLPPLWRLRGFSTVKTLSAISTLAALTPKAAESHQAALAMEESEAGQNGKANKRARYALDGEFLKALGLKDKFILQRDFIMEAYATKDKEPKHAAAYNTVISNTIIQLACFVDASTKPSFETSDVLFSALGRLLENGIELNKLVHTDTVYILVVGVQTDAQFNDRKSWIVSEAVAASNQLAYDFLFKYSGLDLLEHTARLTHVAQTKLCPMAVDLWNGDLDWGAYQDETSLHNLKKMTEAARIPNVAVVMDESLDDHGKEARLSIPYLNAEVRESMFVGILMGVLFFATCVFFTCCTRKRSRI